MLAVGATMLPHLSAGATTGTRARKSRFTLWQLPLHQTATQGNSYVFRTDNGQIVVMDGGMPSEAEYLRGFLAMLGNSVEAWFISHPHIDHIGALNEFLKSPGEIRIKTVYHSPLSEEFYNKVEPDNRNITDEFYKNLKKTGIQVVDITAPGLTVDIDRVTFKILAVKNEEFTNNAYNNSSMVVKVWDAARSAVFLGDAGVEEGKKIMNSSLFDEYNCDFLQMAHHGQNGVNRDFYRAVKFNACLWPTPLWLWNNDPGTGYNTGKWNTVETRKWMDEIGIKKHFVAAEGLCVI
jgi:beta-lactamase superfamily II metal-dependent hydrolase